MKAMSVLAAVMSCLAVLMTNVQAQEEFSRCRADRLPPPGYPPMDEALIGKHEDCQPGYEIDSLCFDVAKVTADCETLADGVPLSCHGRVTGLKDAGNGFLAVRAGPSTNSAMVGKLHNGNTVIIWQRHENWFFITPEDTGDIRKTTWRILPEVDCQDGQENLWVHRNWIKVLGLWSP